MNLPKEVQNNSDSVDIISQMVQLIVEKASPEKIILFGSHANGTARPDSDVDLLIVESTPFGPGRSRRKEMAILWKLLRTFNLPKDILIYSLEEWDRWRDSQNHVIAHAFREGKVLYERS